MHQQLSFFTAGEQPATIDDVEGLLAGTAQVVRRGGRVRIGVIVADPWRALALTEELDSRGLASTVLDRADDLVVQTAFDTILSPLAQRWTQGATARPPADLRLDGARLRLWAIAAGRCDRFGFVLGSGCADDRSWPVLGAALAQAGVAAALLGPRAGGPAFRVTGSRRLSRLRELVGDPPPNADVDWPRPGPGSRSG